MVDEKFKDIILQHLKRILELSTQEFRSGYNKETVVDNKVVIEYVPDTRKQYIQSIESYSDVLSPSFDEDMKKSNSKYDADIKKLEEEMEKRKEKLIDNDVREHVSKKLKLCRELFRDINYFLDREEFFDD